MFLDMVQYPSDSRTVKTFGNTNSFDVEVYKVQVQEYLGFIGCKKKNSNKQTPLLNLDAIINLQRGFTYKFNSGQKPSIVYLY